MAAARTMKRHDTADPITGKATSDDEPDGVDLTVFTTVKFQAKADVDGVETLVGGAVTDANADGTWSYDQDDTDVSGAGLYDCELECITSGGKKVHFPNKKSANPQIEVDEDLDDI